MSGSSSSVDSYASIIQQHQQQAQTQNLHSQTQLVQRQHLNHVSSSSSQNNNKLLLDWVNCMLSIAASGASPLPDSMSRHHSPPIPNIIIPAVITPFVNDLSHVSPRLLCKILACLLLTHSSSSDCPRASPPPAHGDARTSPLPLSVLLIQHFFRFLPVFDEQQHHADRQSYAPIATLSSCSDVHQLAENLTLSAIIASYDHVMATSKPHSADNSLEHVRHNYSSLCTRESDQGVVNMSMMSCHFLRLCQALGYNGDSFDQLQSFWVSSFSSSSSSASSSFDYVAVLKFYRWFFSFCADYIQALVATGTLNASQYSHQHHHNRYQTQQQVSQTLLAATHRSIVQNISRLHGNADPQCQRATMAPERRSYQHHHCSPGSSVLLLPMHLPPSGEGTDATGLSQKTQCSVVMTGIHRAIPTTSRHTAEEGSSHHEEKDSYDGFLIRPKEGDSAHDKENQQPLPPQHGRQPSKAASTAANNSKRPRDGTVHEQEGDDLSASSPANRCRECGGPAAALLHALRVKKQKLATAHQELLHALLLTDGQKCTTDSDDSSRTSSLGGGVDVRRISLALQEGMSI